MRSTAAAALQHVGSAQELTVEHNVSVAAELGPSTVERRQMKVTKVYKLVNLSWYGWWIGKELYFHVEAD